MRNRFVAPSVDLQERSRDLHDSWGIPNQNNLSSHARAMLRSSYRRGCKQYERKIHYTEVHSYSALLIINKTVKMLLKTKWNLKKMMIYGQTCTPNISLWLRGGAVGTRPHALLALVGDMCGAGDDYNVSKIVSCWYKLRPSAGSLQLNW